MAGSSNATRVLLVAVLLMFLIVNAQGRALTWKRTDGHLPLRQLGYGYRAELSFVDRASTMDVNPTRVAPGGPDPQHHIATPSALREP
ncbi:uncharacterized protein J3R85_003249 [Psidium guajava]|nr:uncharacterized protein J3R85_003249 [Psidium guajava]